jgi:hypothetical protein
VFTGALAGAVATTEQLVDRTVSPGEFNRLRGRLTHDGHRPDAWPRSPLGCAVSSNSELWSAASRITEILATARDPFAAPAERYEAERARCADLVRDIFGSPFISCSFSPDARTDTALSLARQMHGARDFSAMPILADALQDAGCDNTDILDHCRGPVPHVRGCWVVDLVLGKV